MFSSNLTQTLANHPLITLERSEIKEIPGDSIVVLATGPLTSDSLAQQLQDLTGMDYLNFF